MNLVLKVVPVVALGVFLAPAELEAQSGTPESMAAAAPIGACSLLQKEEVRKYLPWRDALDSLIEEAAVGTGGSSCNYPSVFIQLLPYSQGEELQ